MYYDVGHCESNSHASVVRKTRTQKERREATRAALIETAQRLFGEGGYDATSLDMIAAGAGATKGALYHHFPLGKLELFEAVVLEEQAALVSAIDAVPTGDASTLLERQLSAYYEAGIAPAAYQITMVDAPAILGRKRWREIEYAHGARIIETEINRQLSDLDLTATEQAMLAAALYGAFHETTIMIAEAENKDEARQTAIAILKAFCER
jgi:AcrR family transcriptional regulator